jgi:hypothetical protein
MRMMINPMQRNFSYQLPFHIKEIQTSMIRFRTHNTHPLAVIETRSKQRTKNDKAKSNNSHKRDIFKNYDLKKPSEKSHILQMSFTGAPAQLDRREKIGD